MKSENAFESLNDDNKIKNNNNLKKKNTIAFRFRKYWNQHENPKRLTNQKNKHKIIEYN